MKTKLDWHKLKSGAAPLPNEEVVLAFPKMEWLPENQGFRASGYTFSAGTVNDRDLSGSGIYWAYLPDFEPPEILP